MKNNNTNQPQTKAILPSLKNKKAILVFVSALIVFALLYSFAYAINGDFNKNTVPAGGIRINEIMTSNKSIYPDDEGNFYDWVELYNDTGSDVSLKNYGLSGNAKKPAWLFGDVTIKSKEYLVVFLCGAQKPGLYAPFKLSSDGSQTLHLFDSGGAIVHHITPEPMSGSVSYSVVDGHWSTTGKITPGYENSDAGYDSFVSSKQAFDGHVKITELMCSNHGAVADEDGEFFDYCEITNFGDTDIRLNNFSLTDDELSPFKWQFPDIVLKPNECTLVFLSGKTRTGKELHANFKISNAKSNLYLYSGTGAFVDSLSFAGLRDSFALIYDDADYYESPFISPGFLNTPDGIAAFAAKRDQRVGALVINEFIYTNNKYIPQNGGNFYPLVELKNNSGSELDLSEYYLSGNKNIKDMYKLPAKKLKPGELIVIVLSGNEKLSNSTYYHANFNPKGIGDAVYLYKKKVLSDYVFAANLPDGHSLGRNDREKGFFIISSPTFGSANNTGQRDIAISPDASLKAGVFSNTGNLTVSLKAGGSIHYTLDGSVPTASSARYSGPISISRTCILKAVNIENGKMTSPISVNSYIINENHALPVVSISTAPSDFADMSENFYSNIERPASIEFFENGKDGFSLNCGLKIFGSASRQYNKKSFQVKFKNSYGQKQLDYELFDTLDYQIFEELVIRSGGQDQFYSMMRDELITEMASESLGLDVQAYKQVVLYINGQYWGAYYIREKINKFFIAQKHNIPENSVNLLEADGRIVEGDSKGYKDMIQYVKDHDLSVAEHYDYVADRMDIQNYIDHQIVEIFTADQDSGNIRYWQSDAYDSKWRWILYDCDLTMDALNFDMFDDLLNPQGHGSNQLFSNTLFRGLMQNSGFRDMFKGKSGKLTVTKTEPRENEIAAITSATITSRAVVAGVNDALEFFRVSIKGNIQ